MDVLETRRAAAKVKAHIRKHGLSQKQFGQAVGVSQGMVWQWINRHRPISPRAAVKIERATGGEIKRQELLPSVFSANA